MIKQMGKITLAAILAAVVLGMPLGASAQDTMKPKKNDSASKPPATKTVPFNGKLDAVDKTAKTVTLSGKTKETFQITSETKIMKDSKPATFEDAVVGETIHGSYKKTDDGKMVAVTLNFGAPTKTSGTSKPKPADTTAAGKKN